MIDREERRDPLKTESEVLKDMQRRVLGVNLANGWYSDSRSFGEDVALLHSEVSEMLEAYRHWGLDDMTETPHGGGGPVKPEGIGSEAADVLIRLLDTCERFGINLSAEFDRKLNYNEIRGHRHGNKKL